MKENQRITLTKRLLKDALLKILKKKDIEKISVSELCTTAGINRATFYRHYEIPLDILHEIQDEFIEELKPLTLEPKSIQEVVKEFERVCTYLQNNQELAKLLMQCSATSDFSNILKNYCQKFFATKYKNPLDEESMYLIICGLAGGGYALLRTWLLEDCKKSPKEMGELITKFISYGSNIF